MLKSDYGCEGAEVVIGADVDDAAWADALCTRAPRPLDRAALLRGRAATATGARANFGVYVVGGEAAGFFSRIHRGATDYHATTVATLVEREVSHG